MTVFTRRQLYYVTIKHECGGGVPGHCAWFKTNARDPDYYATSGEYRKEIERLLGGPISEKIGMSESSEGELGYADVQVAAWLTAVMKFGPPEIIGWSFDEVKGEVELALYEIRDEVERTLTGRWRAVEAVTRALLEQETLKGRQVRQLVKSLD